MFSGANSCRDQCVLCAQAQILALVVSKFVLIWKMRKMVDRNNQARRGLLAILSTDTIRKAEAVITQQNEEEDIEKAKKSRGKPALTPLQRMQRQVAAIRFAHRLGVAMKQRESVDDIVLEVSEAVAAHWIEIRWYYCAVVYWLMCLCFFFLTFILAAQ